jgi:hypothetical protein
MYIAAPLPIATATTIATTIISNPFFGAAGAAPTVPSFAMLKTPKNLTVDSAIVDSYAAFLQFINSIHTKNKRDVLFQPFLSSS